jgi:hypothetical protein
MNNKPIQSDSGLVSLRDLYTFTRKYFDNEEALRLERTELGSQYAKIVDGIVSPILDTEGFYLWGGYNEKGLWANIYFGMAGYGETKSLKKRIREELMDERCAIWRLVHTHDDLMAIRDRIHNGKYAASWKRAMRKAGASHVAWVSAPNTPNESVRNIESDLIEALNPRANLKRPAPPDHLQEKAAEIFTTFRTVIHKHRHEGFPILPKGGLQLEELLLR